MLLWTWYPWTNLKVSELVKHQANQPVHPKQITLQIKYFQTKNRWGEKNIFLLLSKRLNGRDIIVINVTQNIFYGRHLIYTESRTPTEKEDTAPLLHRIILTEIITRSCWNETAVRVDLTSMASKKKDYSGVRSEGGNV